MSVSSKSNEKIVQTAGRAALGDFAPEFAHFNDDVLFGENWNDGKIDTKMRCVVTVVALMAQGITDSSLKYHLENARKNGVSKDEISAIVTHVAFYAGWPKAWAVFNMANTKHWHGAKKDSWFSHITYEPAGEGTCNEWLERGSDEEYGKLGEQK